MHTDVAFVTGGGRGIGRGIAQALAGAGHAVAVAARSADELDATVAALGGQGLACPLDVTDHAAVRAAVASVERELGPIGLLVNNAGISGEMGPLWDADPDHWWRTVAVHVRGAFNASHAVLPQMVACGRGRVVSLVSGLGARDDPYVSAYSCAKAALFRLTGVLAAEGAAHGVTAFSLGPGLVRTRMTQQSILGEPGREYFPAFADLPESAYSRPEDVGALVVRIAAGDADALSGRFVQVGADLGALVAAADDVRARDLLSLRLRAAE